MIEVKHLDKSFGDLHILKDISTNIEKGEKVVIIGPSGSGKSTFLRCLNRLEQPSGGQILFEGEDLTHMPDRQLYAVRHPWKEDSDQNAIEAIEEISSIQKYILQEDHH